MLRKENNKFLKINLQLFAEPIGGDDGFSFEDYDTGDTGEEVIEDDLEVGENENDIEVGDEYEDTEEDSEGQEINNNGVHDKAQNQVFKPYENIQSNFNNPTDYMTEQKAKAIFENEAKIDPVAAWQNYAKNMLDAQQQNFNSQYGQILKQQKFQQELGQVANRYKDFTNYDLNEVISEVDKDYAGEYRLNDRAAYEMAYLRAKVKELEGKSKEAFTNGKKAALKRTESKKKLHNEVSNAKSTASSGNYDDFMVEGDGGILF